MEGYKTHTGAMMLVRKEELIELTNMGEHETLAGVEHTYTEENHPGAIVLFQTVRFEAGRWIDTLNLDDGTRLNFDVTRFWGL